jgi:hypothetical protein
VVFFAEPDQISDVRRRITEEVLPRFSQVPEFLGFVALQSEGSRPEIVAMSFWKEGLEDSEAISEQFRDEIERVTGAALARKEFSIVKMLVRGSNGDICLDVPIGDDTLHRCPRGHRLTEEQVQTERDPGASVMYCPTCNANYRKQPDDTFTPIAYPPRPTDR